jgi:hypothetical protein
MSEKPKYFLDLAETGLPGGVQQQDRNIYDNRVNPAGVTAQQRKPPGFAGSG